MAILLLKALRDEIFDHEPQKMFSFFSSDLHKFKLKTQLKALTNIADEKEVAIKDAIKIISSLNSSQKLLVSEELRLVKLILTVPASIAVSERSCSTLHRFKFYLRSSITQQLLSSYLIIATFKEKVDKLKLLELANQFYFKNEHHFSI